MFSYSYQTSSNNQNNPGYPQQSYTQNIPNTQQQYSYSTQQPNQIQPGFSGMGDANQTFTQPQRIKSRIIFSNHKNYDQDDLQFSPTKMKQAMSFKSQTFSMMAKDGTKVVIRNQENQAKDPFNDLTEEEKAEYAEKGKDLYLNTLKQSLGTSEYRSRLSALSKQGGKNYIDQEFPPNVKSLVGENKSERYIWTSFKWLRPQEFLQGDINVFSGGIEPGDIKQGYLGDCYFLSTLAALAEWPERIKKLFKNRIYPNWELDDIFGNAKKFGCYFVNVLIMGEWKEIIMDDYFPCINAQKGPAFTKANGPELWVMLLEKAWAKIYNSYDNIEAGLTRECLHDLTGAPTKTIWTDEDHLWPTILKGEKNNWAMTAGTDDLEGQDEENSEGIVGGHAYSLLAGYEVRTNSGEIVRLVKLRNPWGDCEWKGRWSDQSSSWNTIDPQTRQNIQGNNRRTDDGVFFMEYRDFCRYYTDAQFCMINDNYGYSSIKCQLGDKRRMFFKVRIPRKGKYFFTVNQKSKRHFPVSIQDEWEYPAVTLLLGKEIEPGKYQYIEGRQKEDREVWTAASEDDETELEAGTYYILVKIAQNPLVINDDKSFVLSSYGTHKLEIEKLTILQSRGFLRSIYKDYAIRISKRQQDVGNGCQVVVDKTDDGYAFLAGINRGNRKMICNFRFKGLGKGMNLKKPYGGMSAQLNVEPGQIEIALVRIKSYNNFRFNFTRVIEFQ